MTEEDIERILAIYRAEIQMHPIFILRILVEHYELQCSNDKQAYIDALVEHYRKQLEGKA